MRIREGIRSLSVYFILISILVGYIHLRSILVGDHIREKIFGVLGFLIALCFFFIGVRFKFFVLRNIEFIYFTFVISITFFVIKSILTIFTAGSILGFLQPIIGGLVFWYLFTNVKRLSQEENNNI